MNRILKASALVVILAAAVTLTAQQTPSQQDQQVPDSPTPQASPLNGIKEQITPGIGEKGSKTTSSSADADAPSLSHAAAQDDVQKEAPQMPKPGEAVEAIKDILITNVNYIDLPVAVKDQKGNLVAGLTYRDFKVYENGNREPLKFFSVDPRPLSIAFVIDQSVTSDVMAKVNESLGSIQNALTPYDELAVISYNNGAEDRSHGFTGAQSTRVPYVLAMTKNTGRDMLVPIAGGPFGSCPIQYNGSCADPNIRAGFSAGAINSETALIPKEPHTLNDAILAAARQLATRDKERVRVLYVISDGKELGSKATYKEVLRYLQTNKIAVYATLVGDSARWGEGYLNRFHIPGTMQENILIKYAQNTGGTLDAERNANGISKSYAKIAEEARTQYTLGYVSHQPVIDGKFRAIDVRVTRPGLDVIAKKGYYPSAQDLK